MRNAEKSCDIVIKPNQVILREEETQDDTARCLGQFEVINRSTDKAYIYKVRGNKPKEYRLKNSFCVIEPSKSIVVYVRLVEMSGYSQKDLFQIKYYCIDKELRSPEETTSSLWSSLQLIASESNEQFLSVILAEQQKKQYIPGWNNANSDRIQTDLSPQSAASKQQASAESLKNQVFSGTYPVSNFSSKFYSNDQSKPSSSRMISHIALTPRTELNTKVLSTQNSFFKNRQNEEYKHENGIISGFRSNSAAPSSSRYTSHSYAKQNGQQNEIQLKFDAKDLFEQLVVKVDEQDKQLFVLNKERKALESEWKALSKQQEQQLNSELQDRKSRNLNSINFSSAAIIAFISLLIGIFLGN